MALKVWNGIAFNRLLEPNYKLSEEQDTFKDIHEVNNDIDHNSIT